jgi:23S rRNA 5-hydroxycytidine C2501 synthase
LKSFRTLELLAPAKNAETGIAAINYGADAVYIGAPRFSARADASNSISEIEKLARYARRFHARVYAAFNTILFDHELEEARRIIVDLVNAGIDALIIQDMGILEMDLPPIEWHASTQTNNYEPGKILFLEKAGFSRVILARELTLEQITEIREQTTVDLEFFVHGALCVSLSGQCYMSLASGDRSGNRGVCAQPCRKLYDLEDARGNPILKQKHLLSLRDLDLSDYIQKLAKAGISSFKIEGRLKDLHYVKNITAWYRKKIDAFLNEDPSFKKGSSGTIVFDFQPNPAKTFSRGSSHYFMDGRNREITSFNSPKSIGEPVGTVTKSSGHILHIKTDCTISNNDGLSYFSENEELQGVKVNVAKGSELILAESAHIKPGTRLFRNHDHIFGETLKNSRTRRKIRLKIELFESQEGLILKGKDEDDIELEMRFSIEKQPSNKPERAGEVFVEQLSRSGDTDFDVTEVSLCWNMPLFMPVSGINSIRREFLEAFMEKRFEYHPRPKIKERDKTLQWHEGEVTYLANISNHLSARFYQKCGVEKMEPALETSRDFREKQLMTMKHCLKYQLGYCPKENRNKTIPWEEPLLLRDGNRKFRLDFDCGECKMNVYQIP